MSIQNEPAGTANVAEIVVNEAEIVAEMVAIEEGSVGETVAEIVEATVEETELMNGMKG